MGYVKELSDVDLSYAKGVHLKLLQNRTHKFNFGRDRHFEKNSMWRYVKVCEHLFSGMLGSAGDTMQCLGV